MLSSPNPFDIPLEITCKYSEYKLYFDALELEERLTIYNDYKSKLPPEVLHQLFHYYVNNFLVKVPTISLSANNNTNPTLLAIALDYFSAPYSPEQIETFRKVMQDVKSAYDMFASVNTREYFGVDFSMSVVGGALRDIYLKSPEKVKDIDLAVTVFPNGRWFTVGDQGQVVGSEYFESEKDVLQNNLIKAGFAPFVFNPENGTTQDKQFYFHILEQLIAHTFTVEKKYPKLAKNDHGNPYINLSVNGIIKVKDNKLNYPMDLMLMESDLDTYVFNFDFEICKIWMHFDTNSIKFLKEAELDNEYNSYQLLNDLSDENIKHMMSKVKTGYEFLECINEKKLELHAVGRSVKQLEKILMDHYPRLKEKYPQYTLKIADYSKEKNEDVKTYLDKFKDYDELQSAIPDVSHKPVKRNKI